VKKTASIIVALAILVAGVSCPALEPACVVDSTPYVFRLPCQGGLVAPPSGGDRDASVSGQYVSIGFSLVSDSDFDSERIHEELTLNDPIEGFNRVMYHVNYGLAMYLIRPIAIGYSSVMPKYGIQRMKNMTDNLGFLTRTFSCLLQGRCGDGGEEFLRFLSNTTMGVAGFWDVADPLFGFKQHDEDFGQAFASWGIGPGCYLLLPCQGPSTGRDAVGLIFDYAFDAKTYLYGGQSFALLNSTALYFEEVKRLNDSNRDPYKFMKDL